MEGFWDEGSPSEESRQRDGGGGGGGGAGRPCKSLIGHGVARVLLLPLVLLIVARCHHPL